MWSREPGAVSIEVAAPIIEKPVAQRGRWARRGVWETSLIVAGLLLRFMLLPHYLIGDGDVRYLALQQLLTGHGLSTTKYSLIGPLFAAPLWYLASLASAPLLGIIAYNTVLFGLTLIAFYWVLSPHMDHHVLRVFLLTLSFFSMFSYHLGQFYGEVFTASLVGVGLTLLALRGARKVVAGALLITLGVANTPAVVIALALTMGPYIWQTRRLRYALIVVASVALILLESWVRRGSPFTTGYAGDRGATTAMPFSTLSGFGNPFLIGLLSVLFSFGKGLVYFTPGLFLPVRRRIAKLKAAADPLWTMYLLWLWFVIGLILVYAKWWDWSGDWFWGPRFYLFACIPASLALALWTQQPSARLSRNLLALGALALSVWVGIDGPVFDQAGMTVCTAHNSALLPFCNYTPDFSALLLPFVNAELYGLSPRFMAIEELTPRAIAYGCFVLCVGAYVAAPLILVIWRQSRAALAAWAPQVATFLGDLRL